MAKGSNKMVTNNEAREESKRYFFPTLGRTIEAASPEEALKKAEEEAKTEGTTSNN